MKFSYAGARPAAKDRSHPATLLRSRAGDPLTALLRRADIFRFLPGKTRAEIVRRHLGPSSPWHLREAFESSVEVMAGRSIRRAEKAGGQVRLELIGDRTNGQPDKVATDHVICATGYHPDVRRSAFSTPTSARASGL